MRILIIGEYSAFSKYLSLGFRKLGCDSFIFSWGDSFKKIEQDVDALSIDISNFQFFGKDIRGTHIIKKILGGIKLRRRVKHLTQAYDCALIINPVFVSEQSSIFCPYPTMNQVISMLKNPTMVFLSACGNDYVYNSSLPYITKAGKYNVEKYTRNLEKQKRHFDYVTRYVRGVIPVMISYSYPYKTFSHLHNCKVFNTIPLPFDTTFRMDKVVNDKIWILHGITRANEKGTPFILKALERIQKKYNDKVVINIVEKIPFKEYLNVLSKTDILIDQCHASSYGMNSIEALSLGKVVLSGNEPGNAEEFRCDYCPVINITPDATQIEKELERLINDSNIIKEISKDSLAYAQNIHDCECVAKQYVELFRRELEII